MVGRRSGAGIVPNGADTELSSAMRLKRRLRSSARGRAVEGGAQLKPAGRAAPLWCGSVRLGVAVTRATGFWQPVGIQHVPP